jgi:hypothetical protein
MGKSRELFEEIRNEMENNNSDNDEIEIYYENNYIETVTIGSIYKQ